MTRGRFPEVASAFGAGVVFALGLGIGGMTRPSKVVAFLDVAGRWDPSLAFVMGAAVAVGLGSFVLVLRRASPVLASRFLLPVARGVDARLLLGSAVFGAGWGLSGICPGPALVSLVTATRPFAVFGASMVIGMAAAERLAAAVASRDSRQTAGSGAHLEAAGTESPRIAAPASGAETTCG